MSLRSPLGRVLGRGAAKSGVAHWWVQRVSAIALVPLTLWFLIELVSLPLADHASVCAWIAGGWTPVALVLLIGTSSWHSALGVQVVIEDYVHHAGLKLASLLASSMLHVLVAVAGIYAVLRVAFTTPFTQG
ncbi:MAG: succinate dehydrogenase, hydrophobic membrane anchor protein [Steroidobacteraceae bacterium]